MQPQTILMFFGSALLYLALGIHYTETLRSHWPEFRNAADKHPVIYSGSIIIWPAIFAALTARRIFEILTKSRKNDWPKEEEKLPEFLKRQAD